MIDIEYLKAYVVNEELYQLCIEEEQAVKRLLNIVENKIKIYLDIEQFKQEDWTYLYPDDLKEAIRFLVESLYLNRKLNATQGKLSSYTEKHDDYSDSKTFEKTWAFETFLWYDIPIIKEYLAILNRYRGESFYSPSGRFII